MALVPGLTKSDDTPPVWSVPEEKKQDQPSVTVLLDARNYGHMLPQLKNFTDHCKVICFHTSDPPSFEHVSYILAFPLLFFRYFFFTADDPSVETIVILSKSHMVKPCITFTADKEVIQVDHWDDLRLYVE